MILKLKRIFRAKKLGIDFFRMKNFTLPNSIILDNNLVILDLPQFTGVNELFRDIVLDDEYYLKFLSNRRIQIKTIADIGANVGIFAIAARLAFSYAEIHCYEPNNENFKFLNRNGKTLNLKTFNEAVSNLDGMCSLSKSTTHDTSARISNSDDGDIILSSLRSVLNRFNGKQIDLLKLDCEGSEFEILKDTKSLRRCKFITLEYHVGNHDQLDILKNLLTAAGFQILYINTRNEVLGNLFAKRNI